MAHATPYLTPRRRQVLALAAEGLTNAEIGAALGLSTNTIPPIFEGIYHKLGIRQARDEAVLRYLQGGRYAS